MVPNNVPLVSETSMLKFILLVALFKNTHFWKSAQHDITKGSSESLPLWSRLACASSERCLSSGSASFQVLVVYIVDVGAVSKGNVGVSFKRLSLRRTHPIRFPSHQMGQSSLHRISWLHHSHPPDTVKSAKSSAHFKCTFGVPFNFC